MTEGNWSDFRSWWMDLLKWSLTFAVGFAISYLIIDNLEQHRSEERALCAATVTRMQRATEMFDQSSFAYVRSAKAVFLELYRWRDEQPTEPIQHYWGPAYNELLVSLENLNRRFHHFEGIDDDIQSVTEGMDRVFGVIDPLIDRRLDRIEDFYRSKTEVSRQGTTHLLRQEPIEWTAAINPIPRRELQLVRARYEAEVEGLRDARGRLMEAVERILNKPASELCYEPAKTA